MPEGWEDGSEEDGLPDEAEDDPVCFKHDWILLPRTHHTSKPRRVCRNCGKLQVLHTMNDPDWSTTGRWPIEKVAEYLLSR